MLLELASLPEATRRSIVHALVQRVELNNAGITGLHLNVPDAVANARSPIPVDSMGISFSERSN